MAFHKCFNEEEAKEIFSQLMSYSLDNISFNKLHTLFDFAPRVAERFWESIKREGRKEFESGHLAANTMLPVGYMRDAWSVARYLGVRESFADDWKPTGGIELSLIDMMAQAFFQWQYWLEETIKRSQIRERELNAFRRQSILRYGFETGVQTAEHQTSSAKKEAERQRT